MDLAKRKSPHSTSVLALILALVSLPATAQETAAPQGISLELNRLEQNAAACRATLVAKNGFDADLYETAFELVMFDKAGLISLMTVFDFGALPAGKTRVQRFDLPQTSCSDLTRILVNDVARCAGTGIDVSRCETTLSTTNRAGIEFGR